MTKSQPHAPAAHRHNQAGEYACRQQPPPYNSEQAAKTSSPAEENGNLSNDALSFEEYASSYKPQLDKALLNCPADGSPVRVHRREVVCKLAGRSDAEPVSYLLPVLASESSSPPSGPTARSSGPGMPTPGSMNRRSYEAQAAATESIKAEEKAESTLTAVSSVLPPAMSQNAGRPSVEQLREDWKATPSVALPTPMHLKAQESQQTSGSANQPPHTYPMPKPGPPRRLDVLRQQQLVLRQRISALQNQHTSIAQQIRTAQIEERCLLMHLAELGIRAHDQDNSISSHIVPMPPLPLLPPPHDQDNSISSHIVPMPPLPLLPPPPPHVSARRGNFSHTSRDMTLGLDTQANGRKRAQLVARCEDAHRIPRVACLDLNAHLANVDGRLRWARDGNFAASCKDVKLADGGKTLLASARTVSGAWVHNRVELDERVENRDGKLWVVGEEAS